MKKQIIILLALLFYISASAQKLDSITYNLSINNLWDLSDTYGDKGKMLSGEFKIIGYRI